MIKLYKEIIDKLSRIGTDKYLHFIACLSIFLIVNSITESLLLGVTVSMSIGILKELFDKYVQHESFDMSDIKADAIGILYGIILWIIIHAF